MQQTLNRYGTRQARLHRRTRFISAPQAVINVTQKKCSKRETYQIFESKTQADLDIVMQNREPIHNMPTYWQQYGRHWKMRYRVNVYLK